MIIIFRKQRYVFFGIEALVYDKQDRMQSFPFYQILHGYPVQRSTTTLDSTGLEVSMSYAINTLI